ncbi:MAG: hypothetical protein RIQ70_487 [Bacteroidota bacterium]
MALNFPTPTYIGQPYISGNFSYIWTGSKWKLETRKYKVIKSSLTNSSNITTVDLSVGNLFELNLSDKTTIAFTNPPASGKSQRFFMKLGINSNYVDAGDNTSYVISTTGTSYDNYFVQTPASNNITGIKFSATGDKIYILFNNNTIAEIRQYNLTFPFDLSTNAFVTPDAFYTLPVAAYAFDIRSNGTQLFYTAVVGAVSRIYSVNLPTTWSLTNATAGTSVQISSGVQNVVALSFGNSGKSFYTIEVSTGVIYQYNLLTAWDITTGPGTTPNRSASTSGVTTTSYALVFDSTGTKMMVNNSTGSVFQYILKSAWQISTATYTAGNTYSFASQLNTTAWLAFNAVGSKMYVANNTTGRIYQYTTGGTATTNTIPTVTWPANLKWENGTTPTLPELTQSDLLEFYTYDGGVTYYGKVVIDNIK